MPQLEINQKFETILTALSTLMLGLLNSYSLVFNNSNLISAQTGNLINLGIHLSQGRFAQAFVNSELALGFALGCVISSFFKKTTMLHMLKNWVWFVAPIWLTLIFNPLISERLNLILFSFIAGIALSLFRDFNSVNLNNGIMTGNLKNMYASLTQGLFKRNPTEFKTGMKLFSVIFLFFMGGLIGGFLSDLGKTGMLLVIVVLSLLPYLIYWNYRSKKIIYGQGEQAQDSK